jgi:hypothetical protein
VGNFVPEFHIRLYDKNSESDYFFFLHQNQNIFFSNIGNQNIFLEKKHITPLQVKWSFPYGCELWGLSNCDIIERVHLKYCKLLLNLKSSTPNSMICGELGR